MIEIFWTLGEVICIYVLVCVYDVYRVRLSARTACEKKNINGIKSKSPLLDVPRIGYTSMIHLNVKINHLFFVFIFSRVGILYGWSTH